VVAGLTFAAGHFAFGPFIVPEIGRMCDPKVLEMAKTIDRLERWLTVHFWRTLLTDLPAWACFVVAVLWDDF
jgi:hypothetical protein